MTLVQCHLLLYMWNILLYYLPPPPDEFGIGASISSSGTSSDTDSSVGSIGAGPIMEEGFAINPLDGT